MAKRDSDNIFDTASKMYSKKKKKKSASSRAVSKKKKDLGFEQRRSDYEDIDAAYRRMETLHADLNKKIEGVYREHNLNADSFQSYLNNPQNFSEKQWAVMEEQRLEEEEKIWEGVGPEKKRRLKRKFEKRTEKKRRKKFVGKRKKGWIQMD